MIFIAEISNTHYGDEYHARDLILAAKDSGASIVKSQAFVPFDVNGSMPIDFYKQCELGMSTYLKLIEFADKYGMDLFFSIISPEYDVLRKYERWHKITATQSKCMTQDWIDERDTSSTFISINNTDVLPKIKHSNIMYASTYNQDPDFNILLSLRKHYFKNIGFSDHSIGIENCIRAKKDFNAMVIEKHFYIKKHADYRDTVFGLTPIDFEEMVKKCS